MPVISATPELKYLTKVAAMAVLTTSYVDPFTESPVLKITLVPAPETTVVDI
jgi:hypothetical protein